jgi:hypothetical protein
MKSALNVGKKRGFKDLLYKIHPLVWGYINEIY